MNRAWARMFGAAVLAMIWGCTMTTRPITLAENGRGLAAIIVADDATDPEKHAAAELAHFLKEVTGVQLPIKGKADAGQPRLLVGEGAARLADPGFSVKDLGAEGIVIRTVGPDVIIAGGRPRGTLYAVYTFLEDCVGCRWWSSKVSTIPKKPTLTLGALNVRYVPPLEYREVFWYDAFDGDFAVRHKVNGHVMRLDAKRGGKHIYEGFVHTFYGLIPPQRYFSDHPDWFSLIKGKRTAGPKPAGTTQPGEAPYWGSNERSQLCLTNEVMRRELVKNLQERLRRNPAATIASVSQNDWRGHCECERCKAIDTEEGSPAGSLLRFVNAVAEDIEKEFPHVAIDTLAYQYTRQPPQVTRPRPNVIVRLCSIECSFSVPLEHERNAAFRDDIQGWSKLCNRLYIWDYTTNFSHYVMPHPNQRVLGPNVRFFVNHGVKGLFEQGNYESYAGEMAELRGWVLAQLLWDPSRDAPKLIDEFLDGYYGPAAPHVRAYLQVTHDAVDQAGDPLGCFSKPNAKFLSFATLSKGLEHLRKAEAAVAGAEHAEWRGRVCVAQLPVIYTFLVKWQEFRKEAQASGAAWPLAESPAEMYDAFMKDARAAGMTYIREYRKLETFTNPVPAVPAVAAPTTRP